MGGRARRVAAIRRGPRGVVPEMKTTLRTCLGISLVIAATPFALPIWRSPASYWMDAVFLRVLANEPGIAPILFTDLFANVPADALVRFLSGVATPIDLFQVVMACPKWPFIKAVFSL